MTRTPHNSSRAPLTPLPETTPALASPAGAGNLSPVGSGTAACEPERAVLGGNTAPTNRGGASGVVTRFKRERVKSASHEDFIRSLPCAICGDNTTTEAAHISYADMRYGKFGRGKGQREESIWVVPLCGAHHRYQHDLGERPFWRGAAIDPCRVAAALFIRSQDYQTALQILDHARDR